MEYAFNINLAKDLGLEEAIMMKHFQFWIAKNKANGKHFHDDRTWTYNSVKAFDKQFPFWTPSKIRRILKSLIDQKVLIVGNYNSAKYDRTKWYSIADEQTFVDFDKWNCANTQMDLSDSANAIVKTDKPIPVAKNTDTITDTKNTYIIAIDLYDQFCQDNFDAPAKIDGVQGKAMKSILKYLERLSTKKGTEPKEGSIDAFKYILFNWKELEPFLQKQIKLSQINSNLQNIIQQLKHGKETKSKSIAEDILAKYR